MDDKNLIIEQYIKQKAEPTSLVKSLKESNVALNETIRQLQETIKELQRRLTRIYRTVI